MNRRNLNTQNRIKKLRNAIRRLRYKKVDKEKIRKYVTSLLVIKYRDNPNRLRDLKKEVIIFFVKTFDMFINVTHATGITIHLFSYILFELFLFQKNYSIINGREFFVPRTIERKNNT